MKKNKKNFLIFLFLFFQILFVTSKPFAADSVNFLSLKKSEVNLRQGPSFEYPIKLIYKKKYLPVIIIDKSGPWRKIKDFENNTGWIHTVLLSKKKTAINIKKNSILYKKPTSFSKPIVKLEIGRLLLINKCKINWCKVSSGNYKGWIVKNTLWGRVN